jgi:hypothetical protein
VTDDQTGEQPAERAGEGPSARPPSQRAVEYKGGPLDAEKGPGLGCFWIQVVVLAIVVVLTPLSAAWSWPIPVTIFLLALTLVLLLFVGQTIIFLLRLVAADRRAAGRRRPMRSDTKTVGELEDESAGPGAAGESTESGEPGEPGEPGVRE